MSFYPPIPIQYRLYGEIPLANEFIAIGRKLAGKLNDEMSRGALSDFGDNDEEALDIARKGPVRYKGDYGIVDIECFITHGLTYVTIKASTGVKKKKVSKKELCPVYPCFVPATIEKVSCLDPDISIGDPCIYEEKLRTNELFFYDVSFCLVDKNILLENYQVTSAGWEVYKKGQRVMLGPSARWSGTKTWDCCADKKPFGEELLNPETFKLRYGYLEVYPISVSTTLDGQIIKPAFPPPKEPEDDPDEYYKYQASVCFSHERLSNMCVQEVAIAGITDDGNYRNVTVIYDGFFYYNVPVWIHTDIGTRKREIIQEDPISAESFFDDAALFFPVPEGEYDIEHEILDVFGYPSAPPTAQTYPPAALALVENGVPIGVISVVRSVNISKFLNEIIPPTWQQRFAVFLRDYKYVDANGIYDKVFDSGTGNIRWVSRTTGEELEFLDHNSSWVIYDKNGIARIPNSDKTELIRADARIDPYVNDYIDPFTDPYIKMLIISKLERWDSQDSLDAGGLSMYRTEDNAGYVYGIASYDFTHKGVAYTVERVAGNGSVQVSVQKNSSPPVFSDGYTPCSDNRIWVRGREMVYSCRNAYVDSGVFLLGVDSIGCPNGGGSVFAYKYNTASEDLNSIFTKSINSIISELNNYTPNVSVVYFDLDDDPEVDDLDGPYGYPDYMYISAISYFITPYDIANCDLPLAV